MIAQVGSRLVRGKSARGMGGSSKTIAPIIALRARLPAFLAPDFITQAQF